MSFIVLTFKELKKVIYLFLILVVFLFLLIKITTEFFSYNLMVTQILTPSITFSFFLLGWLLKSFTLKHEFISKIIGKPIIHGLWKGKLESNYLVDGKRIAPIEIYFYIKQTFLTTTIKSFTINQTSSSIITALSIDPSNDDKKFIYTYKFYRVKNSENKVTFGSGDLKLINNDKELVGIYWTSADTCGEIDLKLVNRKCENIDSFETAVFYHKKVSL